MPELRAGVHAELAHAQVLHGLMLGGMEEEAPQDGEIGRDEMNESTLEQYFIEDYKRLKAENESLKLDLARYEADAGNHEYGITDLHRRSKAVKGSVIRQYYVTSRLKGGYIDADAVRKWLALPDDELFAKLRGKMADFTKILDYEEHEFQYTLMVKESRTEWVAVSDGNEGSDLVRLDGDEFCEDKWFGADRADELKAWLLGCLRESLEKGLGEYEKKGAGDAVEG